MIVRYIVGVCSIQHHLRQQVFILHDYEASVEVRFHRQTCCFWKHIKIASCFSLPRILQYFWKCRMVLVLNGFNILIIGDSWLPMATRWCPMVS